MQAEHLSQESSGTPGKAHDLCPPSKSESYTIPTELLHFKKSWALESKVGPDFVSTNYDALLFLCDIASVL